MWKKGCIVLGTIFISNPLLRELRKNIFRIFFFDVILFRIGRKIYMIFQKIFNLKKIYSTKAMGGSPGELSELVT